MTGIICWAEPCHWADAASGVFLPIVPLFSSKIMIRNVGNLDRILRIVAAGVVLYMGWQGKYPGAGGLTLMVMAGLFAVTGIIGFCPLYIPMKMNTHEAEENSKKK